MARRYGPASDALQHAGDLRQALDILCRQRVLLSPRLLQDEHHLYLYWLDSCGTDAQQRFLLEAACTALVGMSRWLAGEALPWQCSFSHARPLHVEQYWGHLGETLRFGAPMDLMRLPRDYLHRPWPGAAQTAGRVAESEGLRQLHSLGLSASLLDRLYNHLLKHIREPLQLDGVAQALGMSASTLKRKLQKHGTHFQEQLDLARKHVALYLYLVRGFSNEEVASYLQFNDTANFRRSFKRWTGLLPSQARQMSQP